MLKKCAILVSSVLLSVNLLNAEDTVKKPTEGEKKPVVSNEKAPEPSFKLPDKKSEELTNDEVVSGGSYIQGTFFVASQTQNTTFDGKAFVTGFENRLKDPNTPFNMEEINALGAKVEEAKKSGNTLPPEENSKFFTLFGTYVANSILENKLDAKLFLSGVKDKLANKDLVIDEAIIKGYTDRYKNAIIERWKAPGKKFLDENNKKEGVVTLPSGIQYKIIKKGEGEVAKDGQTLKVHYVGTTTDGKEFDSSVKRNQTFDLVAPVNGVINGWIEILKLMNKGSKWQVFIPENLAYGEKGYPPSIKPFETLIFEMEVVDIVSPATAPAPTK